MRTLALALGSASLLLAATAGAEGTKNFSIKTAPTSVKAGEKGKVSLQIVAKEGSHVSDEAPLKIALKSEGLKLEKDKLGTPDAVEGKGQSPRFEIPFLAEKKGAQAVDAQLTFIVCTKELCSREQEKVTIPVAVQ